MTMLHLRTPTSEFFQINMDTQADRMRTFLLFLRRILDNVSPKSIYLSPGGTSLLILMFIFTVSLFDIKAAK